MIYSNLVVYCCAHYHHSRTLKVLKILIMNINMKKWEGKKAFLKENGDKRLNFIHWLCQTAYQLASNNAFHCFMYQMPLHTSIPTLPFLALNEIYFGVFQVFLLVLLFSCYSHVSESRQGLSQKGPEEPFWLSLIFKKGFK